VYGEFVEYRSPTRRIFSGAWPAPTIRSAARVSSPRNICSTKAVGLDGQTPLAAENSICRNTGRQYLFASVRYAVNELLWFSLSGIGALEEKPGS